MAGLRDVLAVPQVYQAYQKAGGFFDARLRSIEKYLELPAHAKIIDVGCGPGYLRNHLPDTCQYFGFDTDPRYIAWARARRQPNSEYRCMVFDAAAARDLAPVDVIMMNGLLHHLTDAQARGLLSVSAAALVPGGRIFTLDGCYIPNQTLFRRKLLDWDRGEHVRTREGYEALFPDQDLALRSHVDEDLSWVKYTFVSIVATKR